MIKYNLGGNVMDKMELENAIKNIFTQCLNEPDILEIIKAKLNNADETCAYEKKQTQQPCISINESSNAANTILIEKIDEVLKYQKEIKVLIKPQVNKETEPIDELLIKLKNYQDENSNLIIENENLKKENLNLINENKNIKEKCKIEISKYSIFAEASEIWDCINTLNYTNREYIESLCGSLDILAILSLGRDDGKIEQLWSYLRDIAVKGDTEKIEVSKLNRYFEFCLKVANVAKPENEKYVVLDIEPESEFDMDTCIRTTDSRQIGIIRDILVRSVKTGKNIKYKAIVRVG